MRVASLAAVLALLVLGSGDGKGVSVLVKPDFIFVRQGSGAEVGRAVGDYFGLNEPRQPRAVRVSVSPASGGDQIVTFSRPLPPPELVNLVSWLDAPPDNPSVSGTSGLLRAPASGTVFSLWPDHATPTGDVLLGVSEVGEQIRVSAPENAVQRQRHEQAPPVDLSSVVAASNPSLHVDVEVETEGSQNPGFVVGGPFGE